MKTLPTQEYLKSKFVFDEESGWLIWLHDERKLANWNSAWAGKQAGSPKDRYIHISINGERYLAHRLIWVYLYGYDPIEIDHKDGNGHNNRPDNLREATMSQNIANADFGLSRGVEAHGAKFRVRIWVRNKRITIGSFTTLIKANQASLIAHDKYFGEFAYCNRGEK